MKVRGFSFVEAVENPDGKGGGYAHADRQTEAGRKAENSLTARKKAKRPIRSGSTCSAEGLTQPLPTNVSKKALSLRACLTIISFSSALMKSRNRNTPLSGRPNSRRILGDCSGSDKHYSFRLADSASSEVHLLNVPSTCFPTQRFPKLSGRNWRQENLVSLAGVTFRKRKSRTALPPPPLCDTLKKSRISGKSISI